MTKQLQYLESHKISPNVFLVFYGYVLVIIVLANIVPVSARAYAVFFILGVAGILLLFIKARYKITIKNNILEISLAIPVRIIIKKLNLNKAESIEELKIDDVQSAFKIKRSAGGTRYLTGLPSAVKINMPGKKSYTISTSDPTRLVNLAASLINRPIN